MTLNLALVVAQTIYGVVAKSVALLADAAHNLSDVLGLLLTWGATVLAKRLPSRRFTFRAERSNGGEMAIYAICAGAFQGRLLLLVTAFESLT